MRTCDDFQIDLERRLRGELPSEGEPELTEHLARCLDCRAYETVAGSSQQTLLARIADQAQRVDWPRIERGIHREEALLDRETLLVAALVVAHDLGAVLFFGWDFVRGSAAAVLAIEAVLLTAFGWRERLGWRRRVAAVPPGELLPFLRRHAAWRLSSARWARAIGIFGLSLELGFGLWIRSHGRPGQEVFLHLGAVAALLLGMTLFIVLGIQLWVLPRAKRETADLGHAL